MAIKYDPFIEDIRRLWSGTGLTALVLVDAPQAMADALDLPMSIQVNPVPGKSVDLVIVDVTDGLEPLATAIQDGFPSPPGSVIVISRKTDVPDLSDLGTLHMMMPIRQDDAAVGWVARLTSHELAHQIAAAQFAVAASPGSTKEPGATRLVPGSSHDQLRQLQELDDALRQLAEAKQRTELAERKATALEQKLTEVTTSNTWRIGRLVTGPIAKLKTRAPAPPFVPAPATDSSATAMRAEYESILSRTRQPTPDSVRFAVFTKSFDEGRGDLFVATGLAKYLNRQNVATSFAAGDDWYSTPADNETIVAMLPWFDPSRLAGRGRLVAWVRNATERWAAHPRLDEFDLILTTSAKSQEILREITVTPVHILSIGVDHEWFKPSEAAERSGVVATVNQWGVLRDVYASLDAIDIDFPLAIYGTTTGLPPSLMPFHRGLVSYFEMPRLYRHASIVLDDYQPTAVKYGNTNSRIFEAIASGALPITNTSTGLGEIGLEMIPVYSSPDNLRDIVHEWLGMVEIDQQNRALEAIVKQNHSFELKAQEFLEY